MQIDMTEIIIAIIGLVFTCIITPLITVAFKWIKSKTQNEALLTAISEAQTVATNVVANLQANVVDALKSANSDGKLTADEITEVKEKALNMFLSDLSQQSYNVINANADNIFMWVQNLMEAKLTALKGN